MRLTALPDRIPFLHRYKQPVPVAGAVPASIMEAELRQLPADCHLFAAGVFDGYVVQARLIPAILREIGRQREIAFRLVGEGSGAAVDTDRFDRYYDHLFLWNRERAEIVGAYRVARIEEVLRSEGANGLYLSSLFHLHPEFFRTLDRGLELGRSFVAPQYQKGSPALLLLWKAIGQYILRHPQCRMLCGPVSISDTYSVDSREAVYAYFNARRELPLANYVRPRRPLRVRPLTGRDVRRNAAALGDIRALEEFITQLEPANSGIPVLLRQYLQLGGQVIHFNVDPAFQNTLDALIVVDLLKTGRKHLDRYLGKEGAEAFVTHHAPGRPDARHLMQ